MSPTNSLYEPTVYSKRRRKRAALRDADRTLDNFDFTFNAKMNRSLVFDLATGAFINKREDQKRATAMVHLKGEAYPAAPCR